MDVRIRRTSRVRTHPSVCSVGIVRCLRSSHGLGMTSRFVHQLVLSPFGGVGASRDELLQMAEKSWNGLEDRPRWMTDDARLRERNSDAGALAGMGFETTRVT